MNRQILITTLITTALISGCGLFTRTKAGSNVSVKSETAQMATQSRVSIEDPTLQKVEFRTGTSSVTVEKLASQNQCISKQGAGQITPKGPTEVYRVSCDDGRVFMAKCELRQCQPMMSK